MFTKPTVFILGAGASYHYGYPTGADLIIDIKNNARDFRSNLEAYKKMRRGPLAFGHYTHNYCPNYILEKCKENPDQYYSDAVNETIEECDKLIRRINEVEPLVIDYFLNYNSNLSSIGKLFISLVIQQITKKSKQQKIVRDGNWCRYLLHHMLMGCDKPENFIKNNQVTFITFNYDTSLESNLLKGLKENDFFEDTNVVESFFDNNPILHIYGHIEDFDYHDSDPGIEYNYHELTALKKWKIKLDPAYKASNGILTIAPQEKLNNEDMLDIAKEKIHEAEQVYILGYGFDRMNSENLGLDMFLYESKIYKFFREKQKSKHIFFTNYENKNIVSKRASQLFQRNQSLFMPPNNFLYEALGKGVLFEMSDKNVYDALSEDFEFSN